MGTDIMDGGGGREGERRVLPGGQIETLENWSKGEAMVRVEEKGVDKGESSLFGRELWIESQNTVTKLPEPLKKEIAERKNKLHSTFDIQHHQAPPYRNSLPPPKKKKKKNLQHRKK